MNERGNTVRIAVVEEQIRGIREQQKHHYAAAQRRFDDIDAKMDELLAVINRGRGAYAASLMMAGLLGGFIMKLGGVVAGFFHRLG